MTTSFLLVAFSLGLVAAFTPCALGINLLLVGALRDRPRAARLRQVALFASVRAGFLALVGLLFGFLAREMGLLTTRYQQAISVLIILLGVLFIVSVYRPINVPLPALGQRLGQRRGSMLGLGLLFGLDIPACASPLFYAVLSKTIFAGELVAGTLALVVFGLGMTLPIVAFVNFDGLSQALTDFARRRRVTFAWIGGVVLIGAGLSELLPATMGPIMTSTDQIARRALEGNEGLFVVLPLAVAAGAGALIIRRRQAQANPSTKLLAEEK